MKYRARELEGRVRAGKDERFLACASLTPASVTQANLNLSVQNTLNAKGKIIAVVTYRLRVPDTF